MIEANEPSTTVEERSAPSGASVSPATRLALILTLRLDRVRSGEPHSHAPEPLNSGELTRLARWLGEQGHNALALPERPDLLADWNDPRIPAERILALIARQEVIDRTVQRWAEMGIWVLGRKDPGYPRARLSHRLGDAIPPVFFGIGEHRLLDRNSTAIVGSRDTQVAMLSLAQDLGEAEAHAQRTVISGGARGVDERAVQGAVAVGGSAVVLLGDGLVQQATKRAHAEHLAAGSLLLISPYAPDAAFSTANAMGRNRLIYCLADETIVVASTEGKGGTFVGARDALRRGWGPIWVAPSNDPHSGNPLLLRTGGRPLAERPASRPSPATNPLKTVGARAATRAASPNHVTTVADGATSHASTAHADAAPIPPPPSAQASIRPAVTLYEAFLACWRQLPAIPVALPDLARGLSLTNEQTREWVFRAVEGGEATRLANPTRYVVRDEK